MKDVCVKVAEEVMAEQGVEFKYLVGTMIESPGLVLWQTKSLRKQSSSPGTNDLTQMTFGFSRDDAGKFLQDYLDQEILAKDPFQTLDQVGVGAMVEMGVERGRSARPDLKIGICGEHGGDPASIDFCHRVGLNYVSCSPFRVPVAR